MVPPAPLPRETAAGRPAGGCVRDGVSGIVPRRARDLSPERRSLLDATSNALPELDDREEDR
ncbi:hypothetical protein BU52_05045 [Streptomyces toyocaensis]|uniref:Uncharacterized protein n=1 Tax=Streptomyces toyocaensis TaxID=55952 RepID=A0A081XXX2_STRTO|nr:hypothetical protein [Streptomyces toyocaensis]KES08395.1 hypothetical protein BU52_05045 [Streptomyces toyocaensis]